MKLLFVVNPISGGVDKEPFLKKARALCEKYGIDYHIFKTTGKNDKENLKKLLPEVRPDKVVSVGGDGTTLFTAIVLMGSDFPMGIIPLGSANGMATELFVNPKPIEALKDIIMSERIEGLDMIKVNNDHYSIHIGDVGLNARIVEAYEKDPDRGMITYAKYFLDELTRLKPFAVKVKANGKEYWEKVFMVGICNARKFGTGVPLNVTGNPMDGKFEIVLIIRIDGSSLIKAGLARFDESFLDNQSGKVISTEKAEIIFEEPRLLQLDGEVIGKFQEIRVEIIKSAVRFITHGDNKYIGQFQNS
ncbi:MAG: diacylglycerol kinase [Chlorobi bacterium]|nr:diacylglycerol kinase [Chlorobiota bacterium]